MTGQRLRQAVLLAVAAVAVTTPAKNAPKSDRVINIVAERFTFTPSVVPLKLGEVVEFRIRSLDTNHGFLIPEAGVNVVVPKRGRGDARVLFRAQRQGVFEFICSKPCGAGHLMMRGRIVVE